MNFVEEQKYWLDQGFISELIKQLPSYVFWKNKQGVYLGCNHAFARSLGLSSPDAVIGKTDYDLPVKIKNSDAYLLIDQEVIETRQPQLNIEEEQVLADGEKFVLLTSKVPIFDKNNEVIGILGIYSDITDLKSTQRELYQAKIKAEKASSVKTEFIANMSHDILTPITGVVGVVQDLLAMAGDLSQDLKNSDSLTELQALAILRKFVDRVKGHSEVAMSSIDELLQLCNEILEVVRLESGTIAEVRESFDIRLLCQRSIDLLSSVATHQGLNLSLEVDDDIPKYLMGLRMYLDRSLLNIISNALKFTTEGFVKVALGLVGDNPAGIDRQNKDQPGSMVKLRFRVEDSGIGIPEDQIEVIFDNFSRLAPAYQGVYKGSGLGLYTVKRYLEAMEGEIDVNSEVGKGTCFTITIPFEVAGHVDRECQLSMGQKRECSDLTLQQRKRKFLDAMLLSDQQPSMSGGKGSILIVEDNSAAALAVGIALKRRGCVVALAEDGSQGIEKASLGDYDLIFMDIGLPDMTGIEVAREIRSLSDPVKSQVPIIALTGHASRDDWQECLLAGMQDVISKPAQPSVLEELLQCHVWDAKNHVWDAKNIADDVGMEASWRQVLSPKTDHDLEFLKDFVSIDWKKCLSMCDGDSNFLNEMIDIFARDIEKTNQRLIAAYHAEDDVILQEELHRCLGGIAYLKLPRIEHCLREFYAAIESSSLSNQKEVREQTYAALQAAIKAFYIEYRRYQ